MELSKAIQVLENYNKWRRENTYFNVEPRKLEQPNPTEIGCAIDEVVKHYKQESKVIFTNKLGEVFTEKDVEDDITAYWVWEGTKNVVDEDKFKQLYEYCELEETQYATQAAKTPESARKLAQMKWNLKD